MEFWNNDLPAYLDKHEKNQKEREDVFFFPPFPRFVSTIMQYMSYDIIVSSYSRLSVFPNLPISKSKILVF